jgi:hypothetical protein
VPGDTIPHAPNPKPHQPGPSGDWDLGRNRRFLQWLNKFPVPGAFIRHNRHPEGKKVEIVLVQSRLSGRREEKQTVGQRRQYSQKKKVRLAKWR